MEFLKSLPHRNALLDSTRGRDPISPLKVNNHIHTPWSFSAFSSVQQAVGLARDEGVRILGINDFYVTDGYGEFLEQCLGHRIFPLFNIELIGISTRHQQRGIRINDPNNPGRTYISGKGLGFPSLLSRESRDRLRRIIVESNRQVGEMVDLLNRWLQYHQTGISLSVEEIFREQARGLLRERHLARSLRLKVEGMAGSDEDFQALLRRIYGGVASEKERPDRAGVEDELRARLLKAGAPAFVPEDERAFPGLEEIRDIIMEAGGIPTYPLLLDGAGGGITEFEDDREELVQTLTGWGFEAVEFIPHRNSFDILKEYAEYFYEAGFVVSFGTEHNTTALGPLEVRCRDRVPLDTELMEISFRGAAYQAAHQYLLSRDGRGYERDSRSMMETLGRAIFIHYFQDQNPSI